MIRDIEEPKSGLRSSSTTLIRTIQFTLLFVVVVFLSFHNLADYPTTWFDEGSHLHVPKALIKFGAYADYSSEGLRYYGPTIGVGPTVMLPIAGVFRLFGIGLIQARVVMAVYLLLTVFTFYTLGAALTSRRASIVATLLLVVTPRVALIEYGRQVLGEVPGLFFVLVALSLWLSAWDECRSSRLILVGVFLGLAAITKSQYLLILMPSLAICWLLNLVYYRAVPQRHFIVPGLVALAIAIGWQVCLVVYLGPATANNNFALLQQASAGAAFVFSPDLVKNSLRELLSSRAFLGALVPALIYGLLLSLRRTRESQRWGTLFVIIIVNLVWYVFASIGWQRYAFLGLALACLLVARFFDDLTGGFRFRSAQELRPNVQGTLTYRLALVQKAGMIWLGGCMVLSAAIVFQNVLFPEFNSPREMAAYLDKNTSRSVLIETWEHELGFLTDHNYHYPPPALLATAVDHVWRGGPSPSQEYDYVEEELPPFVLVGAFSRAVGLYSDTTLAERYDLVEQIGDYQLYAVK